MAKVAFVGLGVMGAPMAGHLIHAGHEVTVWNRTPAKAEALAERGALVAPTLAEAAKAQDAIAICVTGSEDVRVVAELLVEHASPGTLLVDHSTIAPEAARQIAHSVHASGCAFVDAPITGGSMGAQRGQLTIFMGGSEADVERAKPIVAAYAKRAERVGESGSGQMMKLANQVAVAGSLLALCECLSFAERAGLDVAQARELIGGGAGGSWSFENYAPKILSGDHSPGFSIRNQRKDLAYCLEAADVMGARLEGVELVDRLLAVLDGAGEGELATTALYRLLAEGTPRS